MDIYGAAYYPEHWDEKFWNVHIKVMKEYGIEWVRIGEFMWSVIEPEDGKFDFSVLDKAINILKANDIKVILGTPTATPPAWLTKKYPEMLPVDWHGQVRGFGSRRHYSVNSKPYKDYALRITEKYASRYGDEIDAWQVDNEFGCHGTTYSFANADLEKFRVWLKEKYGNIENLNKAWGTVFWSQNYNDWNEIVFPINTPTFENPHQMLDIYRFMSDSNIEFLKEQVDIIRKHSKKPITHNFMIDFMDLNYRKMAEYIDFVSWDNYIATKDYDPLRQSANHSLMRSIKHKPFLVIEQQPGRVNWRVTNENFDPEYLGMWTKQAYLDGAFGVMPFRFDQIRFGAEQYHGGLLDYAGRPSKRLEAFSKVKNETSGMIEQLKEIAIYFDYENEWIHRISHVNRNFKYWDAVVEIYKAVKNLGYNAEFVFSDDEIDEYKVMIVPYAKYIPEEFSSKLKRFKGPVFVTAMSALKDQNNWIRERIPHNLIDELGLEVVDFGAIDKENGAIMSQNVDVYYWKEEIDIIDSKVIGIFSDCSPMVTQKNNWYYIGTVLDENGWKIVLSDVLKSRVVGRDFEIAKTIDGYVILNLKKDINVVYLNGEKVELKPFECKKL
ncbi:MAG: beta-galactosidase [Fervidobacterium sp.]|uniref:beta-galactosidase n=1 Tax=Fervidobacterium gondwanense DSM 13020 TaxID=1121883 RepID=A0A1M7SZT3_FERGO|nr:beta-galactosidase [Fervidobacterium gondwanense]UXF01097.1 beta-galactosidase [Fervidobacterium riparium]SHN64033.1 beta-galactosidase [Fervidobacterium gondwanense DSM 13020]